MRSQSRGTINCMPAQTHVRPSAAGDSSHAPDLTANECIRLCPNLAVQLVQSQQTDESQLIFLRDWSVSPIRDQFLCLQHTKEIMTYRNRTKLIPVTRNIPKSDRIGGDRPRRSGRTRPADPCTSSATSHVGIAPDPASTSHPLSYQTISTSDK